MDAAVVAAEASAAALFGGRVVLLYLERCRSRLIVARGDGVAHIAAIAHVFDVRFMGEFRAVGPADVFRGERLCCRHDLRVADDATGFQFTLLILAAG